MAVSAAAPAPLYTDLIVITLSLSTRASQPVPCRRLYTHTHARKHAPVTPHSLTHFTDHCVFIIVSEFIQSVTLEVGHALRRQLLCQYQSGNRSGSWRGLCNKPPFDAPQALLCAPPRPDTRRDAAMSSPRATRNTNYRFTLGRPPVNSHFGISRGAATATAHLFCHSAVERRLTHGCWFPRTCAIHWAATSTTRGMTLSALRTHEPSSSLDSSRTRLHG